MTIRVSVRKSDFVAVVGRVIQFSGTGKGANSGYQLVSIVSIKDRLRVAANSGSGSARELLPVVELKGDVAWAISCAHVMRLLPIISGLKDKMTLTQIENAVCLESGATRLTLPLQSPDSLYPLASPPRNWLEADVGGLMGLINQMSWAVAREQIRPILSGVYVGRDYCQATNAEVLAHRHQSIVTGHDGFVVPGSAFRNIASFVDGGENVRVGVESNRVWFRGRRWIVHTQLIGGSYPDLLPMILDADGGEVQFVRDEKRRVYSVKFDRHHLMDVVDRISRITVTAEETRAGANVLFVVRDNKLHLISHCADVSSPTIAIDEEVEWHDGPNVTHLDMSPFASFEGYGFKAQYVFQALKSMSHKRVVFMWTDGCDLPLQLHEPGYTALVMPRRI